MSEITKLPDGSAFFIMSMSIGGFFKRVWHKLFHCPTFWSWTTSFTCPGCKSTYRCYWDGNDVEGYGINYCTPCAKKLEAQV